MAVELAKSPKYTRSLRSVQNSKLSIYRGRPSGPGGPIFGLTGPSLPCAPNEVPRPEGSPLGGLAEWAGFEPESVLR